MKLWTKIICLAALVFTQVGAENSLPLNERGLPGVHKTHSAHSLGRNMLSFSLSGQLITDESIFKNEVIKDGLRSGKVQNLFLTDHLLSVNYGVLSFLDVGMGLPFYFESFKYGDTYSRWTQEWYLGDAQLYVKYRQKMPEKYSWIHVAGTFGGNMGSSTQGEGIIPRELEFNPYKGKEYDQYFGENSRSMGTDELDFNIDLYTTIDASHWLKNFPIKYHLNLGIKKTAFFNERDSDIPDIFSWSVAVDYNPVPYVSLYTELYHRARMEQVLTAKSEVNELSIGAIYHSPFGLNTYLGISLGVNNEGYAPVHIQNNTTVEPGVISTRNEAIQRSQQFELKGSPNYKFYAGVSWSAKLFGRDADGDGILNQKDKCPRDAEDHDGFDDEDGCPEFDNDMDRVADSVDLCPRAPEDYDGFQDGDGCPENDNDKDLIKDSLDNCPSTPEDLDGFDDMDGCPDEDNDGDGVHDIDDRCPNEREDTDYFEDEDGCPDYDNDQDNVPDSVDLCPKDPEDGHGNAKDGCPNIDADGDGITDSIDKCPMRPEKVNGFLDADGCPDRKPKKNFKKLARGIRFKSGTAKLKPRSKNTLDDVVILMKRYDHLGLKIEGHTDNKGKPDYNLDLSMRRAEAVAAYMVKRGIDENRLYVKGFGDTMPVASNKRPRGRSKNRRVELIPVE